jgi:hypothetical protein
MRLVYILAGLILAVNAIFVGLRLYETQSRFTLVAVAPALVAAIALGALLIIKNVRTPHVDDEPEPPESES